MHSNGNGFRIRVNNVTQADIDDNVANGGVGGANGINFKTVFMFDAYDADTNSYSFGAGDTLNARLAVANNMGRQNLLTERISQLQSYGQSRW